MLLPLARLRPRNWMPVASTPSLSLSLSLSLVSSRLGPRTLVARHYGQTRLYSTADTGRDAFRRCVAGMWYVRNPEKTDLSTILTSLPNLDGAERERLRHALILVTPRLAGWIDSNGPRHGFLGDLMRRIYGSRSREGEGPVSYVGIVDALPAPEEFLKEKEEGKDSQVRRRETCEGLAACLLPHVGHRERAPGIRDDKPALLRICSDAADGNGAMGGGHHTFQKGAFVSLTFPFANTLFTNGQYNTVFKTAWKNSGSEGSLVPGEGSMPVDEIQFTWPQPPETFLDIDAPLHALTARREVVSSMGNVVREVMGDQGEPLKASLELEAIVPKFLAQHNVDGNTMQLQVFARVMQPKTTAGSNEDVRVDTMVNGNWPYQTLLGKGHLYRVMSGGGGWGKKAGLLSLNPATNFDPPNTSESGIFPDPDAEEPSFDGAADIGALVPVGHTIQFFAAKIASDSAPKIDVSARIKDDNLHGSSNTSEEWGTIPQRLAFGNIQAQDSFPTQSVDNSTTTPPPPILLKNRFGALLEGGAALGFFDGEPFSSIDETLPKTSRTTQPTNEFKIDAPNAVFRSMLTT